MLQLIQMPTLSMKEMSLHPNFIMSERLNNMMNGVGGYERSSKKTFNLCASALQALTGTNDGVRGSLTS